MDGASEVTLKLLENEVFRFLASPEAEVLCIIGEWGVGKTYAWNHYLCISQERENIPLQKYSYVSLFGRNSLDDVRNAIVENTVDSTNVNLRPSVESFTNNASKLLQPIASNKAFAQLAKSFTTTANVQNLINRSLFLGLRKQLICIDDIERAGSGLDTKTVLGLVSSLKNDKDCKIVILLNSEALTGENKSDFEAQIEKVSDVVLEFRPTVEECADIGVRDHTKWSASIRHKVHILGITNIRTIKRIERVCQRLDVILSTFDERVFERAVHFAALAAYAKFHPSKAPKLEFIKTFNAIGDIMRRSGKSVTTGNPDEAYAKLLHDYDFQGVDRFGSLVFAGVENGVFDEKLLKEVATEEQKILQLQDKNHGFVEAWEKFHRSFEPNDNETLDEIASTFKVCVEAITPLNANGTIIILKKFGRDKQAKELVEHYINNKNEKSDFWNMNNDFYSNNVTDPDLVEAFQMKFAQMVPPKNTKELLIRLAEKSGWEREDEVHLAKVTPDEYYMIFKSMSPDEFYSVMKGATFFRNVGGINVEQLAMNKSVEVALKRIAEESPMNAERVSRYLR